MEQCPIKEMEILFQCTQDTENSLFEPIPAKKVRPEWFKKLPIHVTDVDGTETETIKKCPENPTISDLYIAKRLRKGM